MHLSPYSGALPDVIAPAICGGTGSDNPANVTEAAKASADASVSASLDQASAAAAQGSTNSALAGGGATSVERAAAAVTGNGGSAGGGKVENVAQGGGNAAGVGNSNETEIVVQAIRVDAPDPKPSGPREITTTYYYLLEASQLRGQERTDELLRFATRHFGTVDASGNARELGLEVQVENAIAIANQAFEGNKLGGKPEKLITRFFRDGEALFYSEAFKTAAEQFQARHDGIDADVSAQLRRDAIDFTKIYATEVATTAAGGVIGKGIAKAAPLVGRVIGKISSKAAESATARAARLGAEGEAAVGLFGPKVGIRIPGANNLRFPDNLTTTTLTEVKNVASQGLTKQLRDYITVSQSTGRTFDLYVRPSTQLSSNLNAAILRGDIVKKYIPGAK